MPRLAAPQGRIQQMRFRSAGLAAFLGEPMVAYRVYCLNGINQVTRAENIEAAADEDAVHRARQLMGDCIKAEVWQRDRLVGIITRDE